MSRLHPFIACLFALGFLSAAYSGLRASHVHGADITYECLNPCTTRVYLRAYRDCSGGSSIFGDITWFPAQSGCTVPPPVGLWSPQVTNEITPLCPTAFSGCTTPGAQINGNQEYIWFRDYNVCAVPACDFRLVFSQCCRNGAISSIPVTSSASMSISDTWIRTGLTTCNNSPQFRNQPSLYICAGKTEYIDMGATDIDGDSLVYALSTCYNTDSVPSTYNTGYSPSAPLGPNWAVTLNPSTGLAEFLPTGMGIVVGPVCFTVNEYRQGQWIGRLQRDVQMTVLSCPANNLPSILPPSNPSPNASLSGDLVSVCGTGSVCFDIAAADLNASQSLFLTWDRRTVGASFTQVGAPAVQDTVFGTGATPPVGRFCWTPPGPGRYFVQFRTVDGACPIIGRADRVITIEVGSGATASASMVSCPTVNFSANPCTSGPYTYAWSGAGGFSSTLQNPTFTYDTLGSYPWQLIVTHGSITDTIRDTVDVVDAFQPMSFGFPDTLPTGPCLGTASLVNTQPFARYYWNNGIAGNTGFFSLPGTYLGVGIDTAGCSFYDSLVVVWVDADISGTLLGSNSQVLDSQKVYLIRYDSVAQTLYAADSALTDFNGKYFFCGVVDSVVFLKAAPDSADFPLELPTYADTALFWSQAIAFHPFVSLPILHNFATRAGSNPGGPGFIGGLITQGANKQMAVGDPVPGLTVFLREAISGDVYAVTRTDANGYFRFVNLPLGDYKIIPDKPAVSIVNVPQVSLTALQPSLDSLDFRLNTTFLELFVASGLNPGPDAPSWSLSPNPFSSDLRLQIELPAEAQVAWRITNVLGAVVEAAPARASLPAGGHVWRCGQALAPGLYFVEINVDGQTYQQKVLKAR
jgi:PKD repeat protein